MSVLGWIGWLVVFPFGVFIIARGTRRKWRTLEGRQRDYQIALRHDSLGLDDIVVTDVAMFRMERMDDDCVWLACYLADGQEIVFDLWREKKTIRYSAREPLPDVVYEKQS